MEKHKRLLQIGIPALILLLIAGVYLLKTWQTAPVATPEGALPLQAETLELDALTAHGLPILINFTTDNCPACAQMAPYLEKVYNDLQGKAVIQNVNASKYPELAANYPVQVVPTQFFYYADGTPYTPVNDPGVQLTQYSTRDTNEHVLTAHQGVLTEAQLLQILADMEKKP